MTTGHFTLRSAGNPRIRCTRNVDGSATSSVHLRHGLCSYLGKHEIISTSRRWKDDWWSTTIPRSTRSTSLSLETLMRAGTSFASRQHRVYSRHGGRKPQEILRSSNVVDKHTYTTDDNVGHNPRYYKLVMESIPGACADDILPLLLGF